MLIVRCLLPGSVLFRIFSLPPMRWMGRITYGAYIFHDVLHGPYQVLATALDLPLWPVALVGTFAIAWLSFRFFESKFLEMKDRLAA